MWMVLHALAWVIHWTHMSHLTHLHHAVAHGSTPTTPSICGASAHLTHLTHVAHVPVLVHSEAPVHATHAPHHHSTTGVHVHLSIWVGASHGLLSHGVGHHVPSLR